MQGRNFMQLTSLIGKLNIDLYRDNEYAVPNLFSDEFAEFDPEVNNLLHLSVNWCFRPQAKK